mgnify:CR=1 FL=1
MTILNKKLIKKAQVIAKKKKLSNEAVSGEVGSALLTDMGNIYVGVSIDASCGIGYCGEHNAIGSMLTMGESHIKKIVAVSSDGKIMPSCGRCRELLFEINKKNLDTEVIISEKNSIKLRKLLPNRWQDLWN